MPHMLRAFTAVLTLIPTTAGAHHGWSGYESSQVLTLSGTIREAGYEHPHGFVKLRHPSHENRRRRRLLDQHPF